MTNPFYNHETRLWEDLPPCTTVESEWVCLVLDNGMRIYSEGRKHSAGDFIHVITEKGREVVSYEHSEWQHEPEQVIGAMLRAAGGICPSDEL